MSTNCHFHSNLLERSLNKCVITSGMFLRKMRVMWSRVEAASSHLVVGPSKPEENVRDPEAKAWRNKCYFID